MTKGYKTSEFWMSLAAIILGAVMASGVLDGLAPEHWAVKVIGLVVSILGALGYTAARGFVKGAEMKRDGMVALTGAPKDPQ